MSFVAPLVSLRQESGAAGADQRRPHIARAPGRVHRSRRSAAGSRFALLLTLLAATPPIAATNGYFAHGYSVTQRAMAGASTAMAEDALAPTSNPAAIAWVGNAMDFNLGIFAPIRDFTAGPRGDEAGAGIFRPAEVNRERSDRQRFYIPGFGYSRRIGPHSAWGVAVYGNGGLNTTYRGTDAIFGENLPLFQTRCRGAFGGGPPAEGASPDTAGFCGNGNATASVDLIQLIVAPTYAHSFGPRLSLGFSPLIAAQKFRAEGLGAFAAFSNSPDKVTDKGSDFSVGGGFRIGFLALPLDWLSVGASYQSRIRMTRFRKYEGLFAEQGDFDIPSAFNIGIAWRPTPRQRLAIDFQRIHFNEVDSVGKPLNPNGFVNGCALPRLLAGQSGGLLGSDGPSPNCLGADQGPGFGWQDVDVWKFGYQIALGSLVLRAGYSRGDQPIPADEVLLNILAPAVPEEHFTLGFSFRATERIGIDLAMMFARNNPEQGRNPLSNVDANLLQLLGSGVAPGLVDTSEAFGVDDDDQLIQLDMRQYELTLGLSYRF